MMDRSGFADGDLTLGIDFGSSRVKCSITEAATGRVVASYGVGWRDAGKHRTVAADWLSMLELAISGIIDGNRDLAARIRSIGCATIAPCLLLIDTRMGGPSSPLLQYDEPIPHYGGAANAGAVSRFEDAARLLLPFTPRRDASAPFLMTANSWVAWHLTGDIAIDRISLGELGISLPLVEQHLHTVRIPDRVLWPWDGVGVIRDDFIHRFGFSADTSVVVGCSDSFALGFAGGLRFGDRLVYMGTFFTVMEALRDFTSPGDFLPDQPPYRWHVSQPVGIIIDRLASSYFSSLHDTSARIGTFFDYAQSASTRTERSPRLSYVPWTIGASASYIPDMTSEATSHRLPELCLAPIETFAEALGEHARTYAVESFRLAGGLSTRKWLRSYVARIAKVDFIHVPLIEGAEGAAAIAAYSLGASGD